MKFGTISNGAKKSYLYTSAFGGCNIKKVEVTADVAKIYGTSGDLATDYATTLKIEAAQVTETSQTTNWKTTNWTYFKDTSGADQTENLTLDKTKYTFEGDLEVKSGYEFLIRMYSDKGSQMSIFSVTITYDDNKTIPALDEAKDNSTTISGTTTSTDVQLKRTLKAGIWNTFCVPFAFNTGMINDSGAKVMTMTAEATNTDNILKFQEVASGSNVAAGTPMLIKPTKDIADPVINGVTFTNATAGSTQSGDYSFQGTYSQMTMPENSAFLSTSGMLTKPAANADVIKGLRAFFNLPADGQANAKVQFGYTATGIEEITTAPLGRLNTVYTLSGQQINATTAENLKSGIYIINGRKTLIK